MDGYLCLRNIIPPFSSQDGSAIALGRGSQGHWRRKRVPEEYKLAADKIAALGGAAGAKEQSFWGRWSQRPALTEQRSGAERWLSFWGLYFFIPFLLRKRGRLTHERTSPPMIFSNKTKREKGRRRWGENKPAEFATEFLWHSEPVTVNRLHPHH